jgi:hypothetical protein
MKRRLQGLSQSALPINEVPDGVYLVGVERLGYRWDRQKPHYAARFSIIEPETLKGATISARLYCTAKALWKLAWFLRDFGYDSELLGRDELDEKSTVGLTGVVKITHTTVNGRTYLNLDAFAPAGQWDEYAHMDGQADTGEPEVA